LKKFLNETQKNRTNKQTNLALNVIVFAAMNNLVVEAGSASTLTAQPTSELQLDRGTLVTNTHLLDDLQNKPTLRTTRKKTAIKKNRPQCEHG
jgi:hypothetical protein